MSRLTVTIDGEIAEQLEALARDRGESVEDVARECLERGVIVDVDASAVLDDAGAQASEHWGENEPLPLPDYAKPGPGLREIPWAGMYRTDGSVTGANHEEYLARIVDNADRRG